jgi:hypothetical protein
MEEQIAKRQSENATPIPLPTRRLSNLSSTFCVPGRMAAQRRMLSKADAITHPWSSSNAVDVQLYAIIAVILSQFVQTWYHRITPDDAFVAEIVQIIAHCTRGLEQRLRHVDLVELLLDELPALAVTHLQCSCHAFVTRSSTNNVQLSRLHGVHPLATI